MPSSGGQTVYGGSSSSVPSLLDLEADHITSVTPQEGNIILNSNGGNVGIGGIPSNTLDVFGGMAIGSYAGSYTAAAGSLLVPGSISINTTAPLNYLDVNGGAAFGIYGGANTAPTNGVIVSGQVGIGTSGPVNMLDIGTSGSLSGVVIGSVYAGLYPAATNGLTVQGNVGIGGTFTTAPTSLLEVTGSVGFGDDGTNPIPSSAGTRLIWASGQSAFRAGYDAGGDWTSCGQYSFAGGEHNQATASGSTVFGNANVVGGTNAFAAGESNYLTGISSAAFGTNNNSSGHTSGNYSFAAGYNNISSGDYSFVGGSNNTLSGQNTFAEGNNNTVNGNTSMAFGHDNTSSNNTSFVAGAYGVSSGANSFAFGNVIQATNTSSFAFGENAVSYDVGAYVMADNSTGGTTLNSVGTNSMAMRFDGGYILYDNALCTIGASLNSATAGWVSISDKRKKENKRDEDGELALSKIANMQVQSWNYIGAPIDARHIGPYAQDFYAAFKLGKSDTTISTADIAGVNMLAIKALEARTHNLKNTDSIIQQQAAQISNLNSQLSSANSQLTAQQEQINELYSRLTQVEQCTNCAPSSTLGATTNQVTVSNIPASLDQNQPNPFSQNTTIGYYIPQTAKSATITVSTLQGVQVQSFALSGTGKGQIILGAGTLAQGQYIYTLIVDGAKIDSKKMQIIKD